MIDLLEASVEAHQEQTAVAMCRGLSTDTWSYARLWQAAEAAATTLTEEGHLLAGDRVLVRAPNCPELVAIHFGCMLAGAILVPLDDGSTDSFAHDVASATEARVVVTGPRHGEVEPTRGMRILPLSAFQLDGGYRRPLARPRPDDVAEIVYTSGTTGVPKGVILTHANIVANVRSGELAGVLPRSDRYRLLSLLPLSHMFEQTAGLYLPLSYGASITYLPTRQPSAVLRALRRRHITGMVVVPLVLEMLWRAIEREVRRRGQLAHWQQLLRVANHLPIGARRWLFAAAHAQLGGGLEFFLCGGAQVSRAIETSWERLGIRVIQGYGATECSPVIAANTFRRRVPGSVGRPIPNVQVRLSSEGEVQVKGPNVSGGYWHDHASTRTAFTSDGWYRTGDLASSQSGGDFVLRGRLRDLIVLPNGMNIYPEDVEQALNLEPEIAESAVFGLPDQSRGGLRVHAVIVPSADTLGEAELPRVDAAVRRANARLASYQRVVDYSVQVGRSLPCTSSGKIQRYLLQPSNTPAPELGLEPSARTNIDEDRSSRITRILADVAHAALESITPASELDLDLHIDSLGRVELAVRLEDELGVTLDEQQLADVHTVADLVALSDTPTPSDSRMVDFSRWALSPLGRWLRGPFQSALLFPLHSAMCRPFHVSGGECLTGLRLPALFMANHTSHFDTPTVLRALPPAIRARTAVAAAADYFYQDARLGAAASLLLNTFPFSREGAVRTSLEYCAELVGAGWSILLYPEGTRSTTGQLQSFKSGTGVLARELRLPVVPVAITGTYAVLPKGRWLPQPGRVTVRFGPPIAPRGDVDPAALTRLLQRALEDVLSTAAPGATDACNSR